MVASSVEFQAEHRAEHQSAFNRWCVAVGNPVIILGTAALVMRHWRSGAALAAAGAAVTAVGHVAEGNLPRALRDLARHPLWSVRADLDLARDVLVGRG
jgi:hypothetical protein